MVTIVGEGQGKPPMKMHSKVATPVAHAFQLMVQHGMHELTERERRWEKEEEWVATCENAEQRETMGIRNRATRNAAGKQRTMSVLKGASTHDNGRKN